MILKPTKKDEKLASAIDALIMTDVIPSCNETLDPETLKLLNEYEMEATMNSVKTKPVMGELMEGPNNTFSATFTDEGSSSIRTMTYDGNMLNVTFRVNPQTYQYNVPADVLTRIREEVNTTLIEAEGSVGKLINTLIRNNSIQLI